VSVTYSSASGSSGLGLAWPLHHSTRFLNSRQPPKTGTELSSLPYPTRLPDLGLQWRISSVHHPSHVSGWEADEDEQDAAVSAPSKSAWLPPETYGPFFAWERNEAGVMQLKVLSHHITPRAETERAFHFPPSFTYLLLQQLLLPFLVQGYLCS
jgi:hypothetical protein